MQYPQIFRLRQHFPAPKINDVAAEVHAQLDSLALGQQIKPGHTVAITAGSRGIAHISTILRATVEHLKNLGAQPFLVPAMGSHGRGTADGQKRLLESYGITEQAVGCPIRSSMETVVVCQAPAGFPIHFDRFAYEADHVLVCNRVKPHTRFIGELESGLMKMMLIGLGKKIGAEIYHRAIQDFAFDQIVRSVGSEVIRRCRIVAGLAIVENAYDQTARIEAVAPAAFVEREKELLRLARQWMARLPFARADVLFIDRIGKNISGTGMDTNVVGRKFNTHLATHLPLHAPGDSPGSDSPQIKLIAVRGLTAVSHGSAQGLGIAEFCRSRVLQEVDVAATRLNAITAGNVSSAMLPLDYATDREILDVALSTIGLVAPADARLLWIADTLNLAEIECSTAYLEEARQSPSIEILTNPRPLPLDAAGNLPDDFMQVAAR